MTTDPVPADEIRELKSEISALRSDLNRYAGYGSSLQGAAFLTNFRNTCADAIVTGYRESGCDAISREAGDCPLWEKCQPVFGRLFDSVLESIRSGNLSPEEIGVIRTKLAAMKAHASFDRCASCFGESEKQLNQQLRLLEAIGIYSEEPNTGAAVRSLPEEEAAALFGDALASPVRIQVIKALYDDGRTFTDLSKLTGLRGGNLLFHLEKLMKSGIIQQKGDRGEYRITYRGFELAGAAADLFRRVR